MLLRHLSILAANERLFRGLGLPERSDITVVIEEEGS
jgi:hypothetical protein